MTCKEGADGSNIQDSSALLHRSCNTDQLEKEDRIIEQAMTILSRRLIRIGAGPEYTSPSQIGNYLQLQLALKEYEVFTVMFLNNRHQLIEFVELFRGSVSSATVYIREVVKEALAHNAAAVVFGHNHPSGVAEPSSADIRITKRLVEALSLVDVRVLDHFVIGSEGYESFAERGLI